MAETRLHFNVPVSNATIKNRAVAHLKLTVVRQSLMLFIYACGFHCITCQNICHKKQHVGLHDQTGLVQIQTKHMMK